MKLCKRLKSIYEGSEDKKVKREILRLCKKEITDALLNSARKHKTYIELVVANKGTIEINKGIVVEVVGLNSTNKEELIDSIMDYFDKQGINVTVTKSKQDRRDSIVRLNYISMAPYVVDKK